MQKRISIILVTLLFSASLFAQLKKGNKMVGASVAAAFFNNGSTDYTSSTSTYSVSNDNFGISVTPSIGWFTTDQMVLGIAPSISISSTKQIGKASNGNMFSKEESSQYSIGLGGFARYYFPDATNFRFFGQYNLLGGLAGSKSEGFEYDQLGTYADRYDLKSSGDFFVNTGVAFGLSKLLNTHTALDFYVGYNYSYTKRNVAGNSKRDYTGSTPDETREIDEARKSTNNGLVLGIGFQVFLEPRAKK